MTTRHAADRDCHAAATQAGAVAVAAAVALVAAGCGGPARSSPDASATPDAASDRLVLGTAAADGRGFAPFAADQVLVEGIQGGFHVWLKIRVTAMPPGIATLHRTLHRAADGQLLLDARTALQIGAADGDTWEQPSPLPLFLCPTPPGVAIVDQGVQLEVALDDPAAGAPLTARAAFNVHCPDDARTSCLALCSG